MKRTAALAAIFPLALAACGHDTSPVNTPAKAPAAAPAVPPNAAAPQSSPTLQLAADMDLSSKVKEALPEPERGHVEVAAFDGVVTLYGTVDEAGDKDRLAQLALAVQGVRSVVNNLVVVRGS